MTLSGLPRAVHAGALVALGVFLVTTAVLKAHQLAYHGVPAAGLLTSVGSNVLVVVAEYLLGLWLITGLYQSTARLAAILHFSVFMEAALWLAFAGQESCGCLGQVAVNPWLMVAVDFGILVGLVLLRPDGPERTIHTHGLRFCAFLLVALAMGVPGLMTMTAYRREPPKNFAYDLRHDRLLHNTKIAVDLEQPTASNLLALLATEMGRGVSVDDAVREHFRSCQPNWTSINHRTVRGWAILESVAKGMPVRSRWLSTGEGYVLIGDAPLQRTRSYWLAGLASAVLGLCWIAWRHGTQGRAGAGRSAGIANLSMQTAPGTP